MNRRRLNIQAKKHLDWRDPDLPIFTRVLEQGGFGEIIKRPVVLTPDEMQDLCQDSLKEALKPYSGFPDWDQDDLYNAAAQLRQKRKART